MTNAKPKSAIARNLRAALDYYDKTQDAVAKQAGLRPSTLSDWMNDRRHPNASSIAAVADVLGLPVDDLINEDGFALKVLEDSVGESAAASSLPRIPVIRSVGELRTGSSGCRKRFVAPPSILREHPGSLYVEVPDNRVNRIVPRGYIAMIDPNDKTLDPHAMYCVCVDDSMVFGYPRGLDNGIEILPNSTDTTVRRVTADYDVSDIDVIGRVIRATMPEGFPMEI